MLRDAHGGFEVERLLGRQVFEQDLQYGRFTAPVGLVCTLSVLDETDREMNLLVPKRRIFERCNGTFCCGFASVR